MRERPILDPLTNPPAPPAAARPAAAGPPAAPPAPAQPAAVPPAQAQAPASQVPAQAVAELTARDVQRWALRELVDLSTSCAARETDIEQRHGAQLSSARQQHDQTCEQVRAKLAADTSGARQQHEQTAADVQARYKTASEQSQATHRTQRQRIEREYDTAHRATERDLNHQVWLAESVFEGTENRFAEDSRKAKDQLDTDLAAADSILSQARELLRMYRFREPAAAPATEAVAPAQGPLGAEAAAEEYNRRHTSAKTHLDELQKLRLARLFKGTKPLLYPLLALVTAAAITQKVLGTWDPQPHPLGTVLGSTFGGLLVVGLVLRLLARSRIRRIYLPMRGDLDAASAAAHVRYDRTSEDLTHRALRDRRRRDDEVRIARERYNPLLKKQLGNRAAALKAADNSGQRQAEQLAATRDRELAEAQTALAQQTASAQQQHDAALVTAADRLTRDTAASEQQYAADRAALEEHWNGRLALIQAPIDPRNNSQALGDWNDSAWATWTPPQQFVSFVRFGELRVDLRQITDTLPKQLRLPDTFTVPAQIVFPRHASLTIHTDHDGRRQAIDVLRMVMARLLTSLPPGRVRFTIIDPVGLGENFAGFMHLADHDENLVGARIWTESAQIEQRLANLTDHMETVIQKYLRNEFATIDEYNEQAGELAEPYRFLVVADFPTGWQGDSFRRLSAIATSGARCGIYTLVARDTRVPLPAGAHLDELESHSANLVRRDGRFVWRDEVFGRFPLRLDDPPGEASLTSMLERVGQAARDAQRVEVSFEAVAPPPQEIWSGDCTEELSVPIGRLGATRLQCLRLGRGVAQHALIAGKTGSGKSTLLHALVTNLALWYPPQQVEFYLVDFKKGVEFKTYVTHALPHARAIAVESDREFGLSVLQRIDAELTRRGELFRKAGVQDLAAYRAAAGGPMPRTLLIIDEFQEFFSEDDRLGQEASLLLDRLVRQGRAFGIHVLLGSQTIGGTSGLPRSTLGQMAVRIALQMSEADSQLILGDDNAAARLLGRPGEAIYNDAGGLVEANSPFQVAWLPDDVRERLLDGLKQRTAAAAPAAARTAVFEGNAPADASAHEPQGRLIEQEAWPASAPVRHVWVGEPVAIKTPTSIPLRRQSGANVLLIGQQDESATALMAGALVSLGLQQPPRAARFIVLDGTPADSPLAGVLGRAATALPHEVRLVEYRAAAQAIVDLAGELDRRRSADGGDGGDSHGADIYLLVHGLQRYRVLRRSEESFDFSSGGERPPAPDKLLAEILRDGPPLGIHVLAWADTVASVERSIDRATMREFDHRVLFQMSAADSSSLIDSPAANKLGFHRALACSEEMGVMEKFRPFALPSARWLDHVAARLRARSA